METKMDQHQDNRIKIDELGTVWRRAQRARSRYFKVRVRRLLARAFGRTSAGALDASEGPMTRNMRLATKELP
jgi:hypothetical protein